VPLAVDPTGPSAIMTGPRDATGGRRGREARAANGLREGDAAACFLKYLKRVHPAVPIAAMRTNTLGLFLRHLALSDEVSRLATASDRDLLSTYEAQGGQAAFTALVRRHGPMVLRTCRRVLGPGPEAEDAFQATFVLLARKAAARSSSRRTMARTGSPRSRSRPVTVHPTAPNGPAAPSRRSIR
jgi:hypothetical protein